ncbi:Hypothetical predicted protein [Mytilus galloprovincialis]|uniref:Chromo domain-containing protein n=1 Tax=Mytilus galloprovincialis TaxID=29158 RepID=A0A8B6HBD3_MYTGA|nr:Hypothetical predicted protein [Mytilus galloprovincialis]
MAEKLDCSIDRVKMWIGNKNARERSVGTIDYSKKKTATKRGPSAYNIVTGDIPRGNMTGSEYLRKAAEVWRGASAEQKQLATEKAKKIKMDPLQNMDSEQAINHHLKIISKSCDVIASLGLQVGWGEEQTIKPEKPKRLALKEEVRKVFNKRSLLIKEREYWQSSGTTVQQTDSEGSIQEYCAERIVSEISSPLGLIEMVHDSEQLDPPYIPADIAEETLFAIVGESSTENIELKPEFREQKLYIIEEILACKKIKNKKQYYIKWEGYSSESNSWEPAVNIPKTLITNFNKKK